MVPAYQIAIQDKWQLQSFWMARELFEAHILAEEWETAIGIFQNHLLVLNKTTEMGRPLEYEIQQQVVQACHQSGHPDVTIEDVQAEKWQTIDFMDNRNQ